MSDAFSEERLAQLDERWRRDPSSRIFVQLAEEYRRGGRLIEAIGVLEQGLLAHPNYQSALVALGRCRLERGDPARAAEALEQAVVHDPSQLVANKLLVEAYLRTGRADRARERLDFYRLFNDRDTEIEALERRIAAAAAAVPAAPAPEPPAPRPAAIFDLGRPAAVPLDLPVPTPRRSAARPAAPFGALHEPATARQRIARALAAGGVFPVSVAPPEPKPAAAEPAAAWPAPVAESLAAALAAPVAVAPEPAPPWGVAPRSAALELEAREEVVAAPFRPRDIGAEVERETIEEPFDELYQAGSAATLLPRPLPEAPPPPLPFVAPADAVAPAAVEPEVVFSEPEPIVPEPEPAIPELEPVVPALEPEAALPAPTAAQPPATPSATLGDLFLAQGHLDEAEREFRAVLELRPGDAAARAGLAQVARRRPAPAPPEALPAAAARPTGPGLTRRKIETLRNYLDRLRRASGGARVS